MTLAPFVFDTLEPTQGLTVAAAALVRVRVRVDCTIETIARQQLRERVAKTLPTKVCHSIARLS
jgi:hypothetical protein